MFKGLTLAAVAAASLLAAPVANAAVVFFGSTNTTATVPDINADPLNLQITGTVDIEVDTPAPFNGADLLINVSGTPNADGSVTPAGGGIAVLDGATNLLSGSFVLGNASTDPNEPSLQLAFTFLTSDVFDASTIIGNIAISLITPTAADATLADILDDLATNGST